MKQKRLLVIVGVFFLAFGLLAFVAVNAGTVLSAGVDRVQGEPGAPNANPPAAAAGELVVDGSFEGGTPNAAWTESSTNFGTPLCDAGSCGTGGGTAGPNTGAWWVWFGGIAAFEEGAVSQVVVIPVGVTSMTWYQRLGSCSGQVADYMEVNIDGTQEYLITADDASCGGVAHVQQTIDISAYADGGSHTIEFHSEVFGIGGTTNFSVDDVSIIAPDAAPEITLNKTVGTTAGICAGTNSITVPGAGADVYYCYEVTNTGDITLTLHDLVDDQLGPLFSGFNYPLAPGASVDTVAAGLEFSATITQTTVNSATWTAFNDSQTTASASATATVTVSSVPTSVSLTGFGDSSNDVAPYLFGVLALLVVGFGFIMRRKLTA